MASNGTYSMSYNSVAYEAQPIYSPAIPPPPTNMHYAVQLTCIYRYPWQIVIIMCCIVCLHMQVLSLGCIISASVCIWKLTATVEAVPTLSKYDVPRLNAGGRSQDHNLTDFQLHQPDNLWLRLSTQITAGWIILASLIALLYQLFSIMQNLISGMIFCIIIVCEKIPVGITTV